MTEIERRVDRELGRVPEWVWDGQTLPVPVEDIADSCFSLLVREVKDLRSAPGVPELPAETALSGLLLPARHEIWVNALEARTWPSRKRFTVGHELGHWCLHRTTNAIWCRSRAVEPPGQGDGSTSAGPPPQEAGANEFAAALLMPAPLVQRHYGRLRREDPDRCFERLCQEFGASGAAMGRRLRRVI